MPIELSDCQDNLMIDARTKVTLHSYPGYCSCSYRVAHSPSLSGVLFEWYRLDMKGKSDVCLQYLVYIGKYPMECL